MPLSIGLPSSSLASALDPYKRSESVQASCSRPPRECPKAAILRTRCEFPQGRYHETDERSASASRCSAGTFLWRYRRAAIAERAIQPPIDLVIHPAEPVRSLEAAAKVVRRHAASHPDPKAEDLLHRIETASTTAQAEAAGKAFRDRAEHEGLLLVPPEDHQGTA